MIKRIVETTRIRKPLVHCITNYVTVNDCANLLLACGASPIMADEPLEVADITATSQGLILNIGTLNERTFDAMLRAGRKANALGIPVLLDPVGVGASVYRTAAAATLIENIRFSVIRGNLTEIKALTDGTLKPMGVDTILDEVAEAKILAAETETLQYWAKQLGTILVATGSIDLIMDGDQTYVCRNGHPSMTQVTGTGCMLSAITGAFVAANADAVLDATIAAVCFMGLCGELAHSKSTASGHGIGTLKTLIIDNMSQPERVLSQRSPRYDRV